jgi:hypothetical protein
MQRKNDYSAKSSQTESRFVRPLQRGTGPIRRHRWKMAGLTVKNLLCRGLCAKLNKCICIRLFPGAEAAPFDMTQKMKEDHP